MCVLCVCVETLPCSAAEMFAAEVLVWRVAGRRSAGRGPVVVVGGKWRENGNRTKRDVGKPAWKDTCVVVVQLRYWERIKTTKTKPSFFFAPFWQARRRDSGKRGGVGNGWVCDGKARVVPRGKRGVRRGEGIAGRSLGQRKAQGEL